MESKKEQTGKNQSTNKLNDKSMKTKKRKKVAKSVYERCINDSYLRRQKKYGGSSFGELYQLLLEKYDDNSIIENIKLVFERYQIHSSPRFCPGDGDALAAFFIDEKDKIQEIIEAPLSEIDAGFPMLDGEDCGVAQNVWAKKIKYYNNTWGEKAYLSGAEIMNRYGYQLINHPCFFGENLVKWDKNRGIIIVDDFTTAIELSVLDDQHIYLARGFNGINLAPELDSARAKELFKGRNVKVLSEYIDDYLPYAWLIFALEKVTPIEQIMKKMYKNCTKIKY